ncbi:hypothetical protein FA10DRAFT_266442 [Acaromyces ingoldii]|uniref:Uncharacterized protein n=1 Tax=Acaromyces ingoldii TaxID=215250 RepID=A0A316YM75_9BASI|nr:hypothetical protein FA10DRAFT_266442 [Acaromyces ingoldii]PWN89904.1 hypothetical protein FA10DRAFT_266442 [Acaromyces ingoldii]
MTEHARRSYSTTPNEQQLFQSFGTPFAQFLFTLSRVARMIVYSAVGAASLGAVAFEATHQYVEHVAMPRAASSDSSDDDEWAWASEAIDEESWGPVSGGGTDRRLGIKGRHLVRSAWICSRWGGGISPINLFSSGTGLPTAGRRPRKSLSAALHNDEGMEMAEAFLDAALVVAESRGIRLPDLAAVRAGAVATPHEAGADKPLDMTAVALETQLASIRERVGTKTASEGALAGYTRVFDALASADATNRVASAMKPNEAGAASTGQPSVRPQRLVKLATKIGDLHALLSQRQEAEAWLLCAVDIAGKRANEQDGTGAIEGQRGGADAVGNQALAGIGGLSPESRRPAETKEAKEAHETPSSKSSWSFFRRSKKADDIAPRTSTSPAKVEADDYPLNATPPPAPLTRSLISALLSLSAFHAQAADRKSLEQALQFQVSALRLTRVEAERLAWAGTVSDAESRRKAGLKAQLHALWLAQRDALASMHIAETIYALGPGATASSSYASLLTSFFTPTAESRDVTKSVEWLKEADERAELIISQLGKKVKRETVLSDRWTSQREDLQLPASRLLRDAKRIREATQEMRAILGDESVKKK